MFNRQAAAGLLALAFAACLVNLSVPSADAARVDRVTKGSNFAAHFKVKAEKEASGIRVSVTAPKSMQEYRLSSLTFYVGTQTRIRSNGTTLEFLIDKDMFDKAFVNAGYSDPNHKRGESGGYWSFQLNISALAGDPK